MDRSFARLLCHRLPFQSSTESDASELGNTNLHIFPSDLPCVSFRLNFSEDSSVSLGVSPLWKRLKSSAVPQARRKPASSEKSKESFHLDHIMVFADAKCRRVALLREGPAFLSPTPPLLFSVLSLFSSGLLPTGSDMESESHPRSPIPRPTLLQPSTSSSTYFPIFEKTTYKLSLSFLFPKCIPLILSACAVSSSPCLWDAVPLSWAGLPLAGFDDYQTGSFVRPPGSRPRELCCNVLIVISGAWCYKKCGILYFCKHF